MAHWLPSGSAKVTKCPQARTWTSLTSTPRPASSSWARWMSATTICRDAVPGGTSLSPSPKAIEQAEPGGVIWTKRRVSVRRCVLHHIMGGWSGTIPSGSPVAIPQRD